MHTKCKINLENYKVNGFDDELWIFGPKRFVNEFDDERWIFEPKQFIA